MSLSELSLLIYGNTVKISSIELINADSLHYIGTLPDNSIDLIVTDPPY
ncbi:DNA adenine methylase, partial [Klebsiella pneumoniae]